jgi:2-methylcitrate dehydratase PrpD
VIELLTERILGEPGAAPADRAAAVRAFEDTVAVMLAGWDEPAARAARRYAAGAGVRLITGEAASSPEHAAFAHAVAGHALDYDDVHLVSVTHPSVVIYPALMALAPSRAPGRSMLDAYGVGVSVNIALGRRLGFHHYESGWHATSTIGPIAAAAAGCHLLGLGERETRSALALAAAQAGGLQRNFGSMAKPVQAGNAAAAGVRAVLLAAGGVSGDADIFGPRGFGDLYGADGPEPHPLRADDVHSVSVKLYPCCYATHRPIKAALDARASLVEGAYFSGIDRIELFAPFETMQPLRVTDPRTGNEGKFCLAYVLAVALLQGKVGLTDFTDEAVRRPEVRAFISRIRIEDDASSGRAPVGLEYGAVELRLRYGARRIATSCAHYPGSPEAPVSAAEHGAKIDDCAAVYGQAHGPFSGDDVRRIVQEIAAEPADDRLQLA